MNRSSDGADIYFEEGCGRCSLGGTPECKVHQWNAELALLRKIVLTTPLHEQLKWGSPCYTLNNANVLMLGCFKHYTCLSFIKGVLLADEQKLLVAPGENSQYVKMFKFTDVAQIKKIIPTIEAYIYEAIELEKNGVKVEKPKTNPMDNIPDELAAYFKTNKAFKTAFYALTPGKQRGYIMHYNQATQSKTKTSRIEKTIEKVLLGKGFNDYK
jgi:uncharacterized protein YdeI (YjbR/CyaY-like superfamily)